MTRSIHASADEQQLARATALVALGAPLPVLESETRLPRERLQRLYRKHHRKSPAEEISPVPMDWFMKWQPNTHASLFLNIYDFLAKAGDLEDQDALVWSYQLYREQLRVLDLPEVLSITHAWRLVKYVDEGQLMLKPCNRCHGSFVVHTLTLFEVFLCTLCQTPGHEPHSAHLQACAHAERLN